MTHVDGIVSSLIGDDAHLADEVTTWDTDLPDNPTLWDALAGPEQDSWHAAVLGELTAIKDTGTWSLVDCTPDIHNIVGC